MRPLLVALAIVASLAAPASAAMESAHEVVEEGMGPGWAAFRLARGPDEVVVRAEAHGQSPIVFRVDFYGLDRTPLASVEAIWDERLASASMRSPVGSVDAPHVSSGQTSTLSTRHAQACGFGETHSLYLDPQDGAAIAVHLPSTCGSGDVVAVAFVAGPEVVRRRIETSGGADGDVEQSVGGEGAIFATLSDFEAAIGADVGVANAASSSAGLTAHAISTEHEFVGSFAALTALAPVRVGFQPFATENGAVTTCPCAFFAGRDVAAARSFVTFGAQAGIGAPIYLTGIDVQLPWP